MCVQELANPLQPEVADPRPWVSHQLNPIATL
jgi:hypothetical protein